MAGLRGQITGAAVAFLLFAHAAGLAAQAGTGTDDRRLPVFATVATTTVDYVFVVDVSESMVGWPHDGSNDTIFPRVRAAIARMIEQLQPGSTVTLIPFHEVVGEGRRFPIESQADRDSAVAYLNSLRADGRETHVYRAVLNSLERYNAFRGARTDRIAIFLVYTDGQDNGPEGMTMRDVVERFGLRRQPDDWLYYATLGVDDDPEARRILEESGFGTYVANPRGEVSPLWIVEPRYAFLNFGNLLRKPERRLVQRFGIQGTASLPADVVLRTATDFGDLTSAMGVNVEVEPQSFRPQARPTPFRLSLVNASEIRQGEYMGILRFTSSSRYVLVRPDRVRIRFAYEPPRLVRIGGRSELRLPKLASHRSPARRDTARATLALIPNAEAARRGGVFYVQVEPDPRNPGPLPAGAILINGRPGDLDSVDVRSARALEIGVTGRSPELPSGRYRGKLVFVDGSVEVDGADPREIAWSVEIGRRPRPVWVLPLLLALAAGAAALVLARRRPVLRGRLVVEVPGEQLREIVLSGKREVQLDPHAQPTPAEPAQVRIVAEGVGRDSRPRVYKVVGEVYIRRAGEKFDQSFHNEVLEEGDELRWSRYRLSYHRN